MKSEDVDKSYLKKLLNVEDPVIFDVGCFDGADSLDFISIFRNPKLFAFEADERSVELFKDNVKNKPITLIETALSNTDGKISFYKSDSKSRKSKRSNSKAWSASSSIKKPDNHLNVFPDVEFMSEVSVKSKRLDTWIKDKDIDKIDLMWVDVNGGESEFIEGAINTISKKVRFLYIEFSSVENKSLYLGGPTKEAIMKKLPMFRELGVFNFMGNYGNILLENTL